MGLFQKFKEGLAKTHNKLVHEIKRVVTGSPKLTGATLEEIEASESAAFEGRISDLPFVLLAQPTVFDPTRAPAGLR